MGSTGKLRIGSDKSRVSILTMPPYTKPELIKDALPITFREVSLLKHSEA